MDHTWSENTVTEAEWITHGTAIEAEWIAHGLKAQ